MPLTEKAATALMTVAIAGVGLLVSRCCFCCEMMAARKRLLNEAIARCDGQDIRNWNRRMRSPRSPELRRRLKTLQDLVA